MATTIGKCDVYVMQTIRGNDVEAIEGKSNEQHLKKPTSTCKNNRYMGGVNKCNQYLKFIC